MTYNKKINKYIVSLSICFMLYESISNLLWVIFYNFSSMNLIKPLEIWALLPSTFFAILYVLLIDKLNNNWNKKISCIIIFIALYYLFYLFFSSLNAITLKTIQDFLLIPIIIINLLIVLYLLFSERNLI